jgi:hypothetical protein
MIKTKYQEKINELRICFKDTEKRIKDIELETSELSIPSINQLRYVAYHLIEGFNPDETNDKKVFGEIKKALHHCQRARFDAIEIGLTYSLNNVRIFQDKYNAITETLLILPNYIELMRKAQEASNALQAIRDEEKDREEYYNAIFPHYEVLKSISVELFNAEPMINKKIEENNEKKITDARRFTIRTGLILLGMIVSAIFAYIKL